MNNERMNIASWLRSRSGLVLLGFLAIAVFFLWEENQAHILGILPFALLLLCPLLHVFMHGGHGGHGGGGGESHGPRTEGKDK